jgi:pimeloyl-ACP methyl ester carboxylesterase
MPATRFIANGADPRLVSAYYDEGERNPPFVLVHGFTGSKLDFRDQLEWFEDLARVIAADQRGHGESTNIGPYTFDGLVEDLIGFLNAIDVHRCTLLGHSVGGMVAMRAALQHPHRFSSLILMDTSASPLALFATEAIRTTVLDLVRAKGCQGLLDNMRGQPRTPAAQRGVDYLGEAEHWRRIGEKLVQMDPSAFVELIGAMADQNLLAELAAIDCPVTIIVGEHDTAFREAATALNRTLPAARLEIIRHAAHSPQYENAPAWKAVVRRHLADHGR